MLYQTHVLHNDSRHCCRGPTRPLFSNFTRIFEISDIEHRFYQKMFDASKKVICKISKTKIENRALVGFADMCEVLFTEISELSV